MSTPHRIRLVILDWAGTTVDHGSLAPLEAFIHLFAAHGITLTSDEAKQPMGLNKRDHIVALLRTPAIAERWQARYEREWTEADVDNLYRAFADHLLACLETHSALVPGLLDAVAALRADGVSIAGCTGYFRAAAEKVAASAAVQGYVPNGNFCADDVPAGRPAPWMIFRAMESVGVYPPECVLKVGDTIPDILEGRNAGVWSVGVVRSCAELALSADTWDVLPMNTRAIFGMQVASRFVDHGAHAVIEEIAELPNLVASLNQRLAQGEHPT